MKIQYSELTKTLYIVDNKGKKTEATSQVLNGIVLWMHDNHKEIINPNEKLIKLISVGDMAFEIKLERIK